MLDWSFVLLQFGVRSGNERKSSVQVNAPTGVVTAQVKVISLGFTILLDAKDNEIVIPNSVMMGSTVIKLKPTNA